MDSSHFRRSERGFSAPRTTMNLSRQALARNGLQEPPGNKSVSGPRAVFHACLSDHCGECRPAAVSAQESVPGFRLRRRCVTAAMCPLASGSTRDLRGCRCAAAEPLAAEDGGRPRHRKGTDPSVRPRLMCRCSASGQSRNPTSSALRLGSCSFRKARSSIWRMRSRVTLKMEATSSRV